LWGFGKIEANGRFRDVDVEKEIGNSMSSPQDFSTFLLFAKNAAFYHWRKASLFGVCLLGLVAIAMFLWGNSYRSDARLFVRLGRESVSIDPTVSESGAITVNEGREIEINSVLQIIESRELAEQVVKKLGEELVLTGMLPEHRKPSKFEWISDLKRTLRTFLDGAEVSRHEKAVTSLLRGLKVSSPKKTSVVSLQYDSRTPEAAQMILNEVVEAFKTEHVRIHRTAGSYEFLAEQTKLLEGRLLEAQNEMRDAKNTFGLVNVEGHKKILQDEFSLLESELINVHANLSGSKARLNSLETVSGRLPERQETEEVKVAVDSTHKMREALFDLQIKEREVSAKYNKEHPVHRAASEQVQEAQAIFEGQASERGQKTTAINSSRQQVDLAGFIEKADLNSLQARYESLQAQHANATKRMKELNMQEVQLAELQRKVDQSEVAFKTYSTKLEEARLEQELESKSISNINIIQPASFVQKPASPNRLIMLALGFLFAMCGSVGVALLSELLFGHSVVQRSSEERNSAIPLPAAVSWHLEPTTRTTHSSITIN
jgi:uncharacterized protein involved in exopolysaccharide biosynthesis